MLKPDVFHSQALDAGQVYVTYFPELEGIEVPEATIKDTKYNRTVIPLTAPIAFFVVKETDDKTKRLVPVAIQTDSHSSASVYKPGDDKQWFLAKSFVQRADFNVLHLVHKRLKTHLYLDAFCTLVEKEMSEYHPVYQLLRHHCRAMLETNKLFEIKLYGTYRKKDSEIKDAILLTLSLPRVINFEFLQQPHQKYYITQLLENLAFHSILR